MSDSAILTAQVAALTAKVSELEGRLALNIRSAGRGTSAARWALHGNVVDDALFIKSRF